MANVKIGDGKLRSCVVLELGIHAVVCDHNSPSK